MLSYGKERNNDFKQELQHDAEAAQRPIKLQRATTVRLNRKKKYRARHIELQVILFFRSPLKPFSEKSIWILLDLDGAFQIP